MQGSIYFYPIQICHNSLWKVFHKIYARGFGDGDCARNNPLINNRLSTNYIEFVCIIRVVLIVISLARAVSLCSLIFNNRNFVSGESEVP